MKPFTDEDVAVQRASLATFCERDANSLNFAATARDIERRWLATVDAANARALEWFDRWVEAVRQGVNEWTIGDVRVMHHGCISTWEEAWRLLGLSETVTIDEFTEAVARTRAEVGGK